MTMDQDAERSKLLIQWLTLEPLQYCKKRTDPLT